MLVRDQIKSLDQLIANAKELGRIYEILYPDHKLIKDPKLIKLLDLFDESKGMSENGRFVRATFALKLRFLLKLPEGEYCRLNEDMKSGKECMTFSKTLGENPMLKTYIEALKKLGIKDPQYRGGVHCGAGYTEEVIHFGSDSLDLLNVDLILKKKMIKLYQKQFNISHSNHFYKNILSDFTPSGNLKADIEKKSMEWLKIARLAVDTNDQEMLAVKYFIKALQLKTNIAFQEIGFFIHCLKTPSAQYKLAEYLRDLPQLDQEVWVNLFKKAAEQHYPPAEYALMSLQPLSPESLRSLGWGAWDR